MMKSRCVSTSQKTVRVMAGSDSILDGGPGQNEDARRPSPDAREGETDGGRWGADGEGWPALHQEPRRLLGATRHHSPTSRSPPPLMQCACLASGTRTGMAASS